MELFQELVFTISFSLIVSLLIAKLFSLSSSSSTSSNDDNGNFIKVEDEKIVDKEWVVCDSDKEGDLGSGSVIDSQETVPLVDAHHIDQNPERKNDVTNASYVFDESPERGQVENENEVKNGKGLVENDELDVEESVFGSLIQGDCVEFVEVQKEKEAVGVEDEDDDWQGIETTELEKTFGAAVGFMGSKSGADRVNLIDNDVKVELYGLHRVAIEGSCFEPQPMALKVSARANWNSWKCLENLGREDAMEQYIALLSRHIPDWMGAHASGKQ